MNTLGRAQAQTEAQEKSQQVSSPGQELDLVPKERVRVIYSIFKFNIIITNLNLGHFS